MDFGLVPIRNFGVIDQNKGIYRAAQPQYEYEYAWLKRTLGLKTIVNLRSELSHDNLYAEKFDLEVINLDIPDHHAPTIEQAESFMEMIKEGNKFPILFHCAHGHGRTSTFSVLTKMSLGMSLEEAIAHEESEFHFSFRHKEQLDFLNQNFAELVFP